MCRIAGYVGPSVPLSALLTAPPHCLREQAKRPRELPAGTTGSDGYGVAWWAEGDPTPARYRHTLAMWADENATSVFDHVRSSLVVASTRTATDKMPVSLANTPPFVAADIALVHNGELHGFHGPLAEGLRAELDVEARSGLVGNTDSEMIAALVASRKGTSLGARVAATLELLRVHSNRAHRGAQLNLIVAGSAELVVVRSAVADAPPSLYTSARANGSTYVASEPFDDDETWTLVPADVVTTFRAGAAPERISLAEADGR